MALQTITDENDAQLYASAAPWLAERITAAIRKNGRCVLGIVGGRSIPSLFEQLASHAPQIKGAVHVFWLDERVGSEKNYPGAVPFLQQIKNAGVDINWHPFEALDREHAAIEMRQWTDEIKQLGFFDIVILSAGEDGHVASLFPHYPALQEKEHKYLLVENAPKAPPLRITASPPLLLSASDAFIFFVGDKKDAYARFLNPGASISECPAKLAELIPNTLVFTCLR